MRNAVSIAVLAFAMAAAPQLAWAQTTEDEIVVTATRAPGGLARDQIGGSVTLFSERDLVERQVVAVTDILRDSPGVAVSRSGPLGGVTQVRMRGAEGNHTLVMIDGIDASDPYSGEFDFGLLIADELARVEVLRGQQSSLYGSDAIGGVIHYLTASGADEQGARARFEVGSFSTAEMSVRAGGVNGPIDWAVSGNITDTDGSPSDPDGSRDLAYNNQVLAGRFGWTVTDDFSLTGVIRARQSEGDFNEDLDFDSIVDDSPGTYYEDEAIYALARAELSLGEAWTHALTVQGVDGSRLNVTPLGFFTQTQSQAQRIKASYVATVRFGGEGFEQQLTGAIDYREDQFETLSLPEASIAQTGYVLEYNALIGERLGLGASLRQDHNDRFEDSTTYRVQASYAFDTGARLRGAIGSGVKNPIMNELFGYGSGYLGNPDLQPEESVGWEIGLEQNFFDRTVLVGATYFDNELENEIRLTGFAPATPINLDGTSTQTGVELFARADLGQWSFDAAYTYLDAEESMATGTRPEIRRAE
ncbi:MAG: TonB-dependent receptor plug domain-containing protein, partial [Hyphomonadaceae bacterium]